MGHINSTQVYLLLAAASVLCATLFALWAARFSSSLKPEQYADSQGRAETLQNFRRFTCIGSIAQIGIYFALIVSTNMHGEKHIIGPSILFLAVLVFQGQAAFSVERKLRDLKVTHAEALKLVFRVLAGSFGLLAVYLVLALGPYFGVVLLQQWLSLPVWVIILAGPFGILCGLTAVLLSAPLLIRVMLPCEKVTDPEVIQLLAGCFKRANLPCPDFWLLKIEKHKAHNAMVSGIRWGKGRFQPALFFTKSLLEHLSRKEFEAIMLHEVSHISLWHIPKRMMAGLIALCVSVVPSLIIGYSALMFLPAEYASATSSLGYLLMALGQVVITRRVVRLQEIEADGNAIRLGAHVDDLAEGLRKLTTLNDMLASKRDPSTLLNANAAHPLLDERIAILRNQSALGFPARPAMWVEMLAPLRRYIKLIAPVAASAIVGVAAFGLHYVKPRCDLRTAIINGNLAEVERLIGNGASVSANDFIHGGTFPLYTAAWNGQMAIVSYLLQHGADVSQRHPIDKWTALMGAASKGRSDVVQFLIERGAKVNQRANFSNTALIVAAMGKFEDSAKALINAGASVDLFNDHHSTALAIAAEYGETSLVKLLIEKGANLDLKDGDGDSPLGMTLRNKHLEIAELLKEAGAKDLGRYKASERSVAGKTP